MEFDETLLNVTAYVPPKRISGINRFRAIVRLVIANLPWLSDIDVQFTEKQYITKSAPVQLKLVNKAILSRDPAYRTDEENEMNAKIISSIKCFRKYSEEIKLLLASYCHFVFYGPNRVIIRDSHYATGIFFLISGQVNLIEELYDPYLDETETNIIETLSAGDVIGEICMMHDLPRSETIVSVTPVEFLILKREAYEKVLKHTVQKEWGTISAAMKIWNYFDKWDKVRVSECCMQSMIKTFKKDDIILGDGYGRKNYVHFVVSGACSLIQNLLVQEQQSPSGETSYKLYEDEVASESHIMKKGSSESVRYLKPRMLGTDISLTRPTASSMSYESRRLAYAQLSEVFSEEIRKRRSIRHGSESLEDVESSSVEISYLPDLKTVYMQVALFSKHVCFSIGEPMRDRRVIANAETVCLLIPSFLLLGSDSTWLRVQQLLTKRIPDTKSVFAEFVRLRKWAAYKRRLVTPMLNTYCPNWHANIPYTIRVHNDFNFKPKKSDPMTRAAVRRATNAKGA